MAGVLCGRAGRADGWNRGKSPASMEGSHPRRKETPRRGLTRRLRRGLGLVVHWGAHTFLSMAKEKCAKESQRHGDSRGGPPRFALFANIGVPGTAVPGSCICSGLPVANCLRQLCPLGTRSLSAQASACGSRTVGCPEFIRGIQFRPLGRNSLTTFRGQTALRGCPRPWFALLTRRDKGAYCPFCRRGSQCRAQ